MLTSLTLALTLASPALPMQVAGASADPNRPGQTAGQPGAETQGSEAPSEKAPAASPAPGPDTRRAELREFSLGLERRLSAACRSAEPIVFMSGLPETRFVYLDGVGAIFLLPARSLPNRSASQPNEPPPEVSVSPASHGSPPDSPVRVTDGPTDLADLEARIRETRKQAERMRAQADAAFADAERQIMAELRPGLSESTVAAGLPAWRLLIEDSIEDTRPPEQVEQDVKDAMIAAILEDGTHLRSLQPNDMVTTSVDLVSRPRPWIRAKPARTVTVKARKADLDAYEAGKLTREDLLKRVQTKAY